MKKNLQTKNRIQKWKTNPKNNSRRGHVKIENLKTKKNKNPKNKTGMNKTNLKSSKLGKSKKNPQNHRN